jgi:hypothetical protein
VKLKVPAMAVLRMVKTSGIVMGGSLKHHLMFLVFNSHFFFYTTLKLKYEYMTVRFLSIVLISQLGP